MATATEIAEAVQSGVLKAVETSQRLTIEALTAATSTIDGYLPERPAFPFASLISPQEMVDASFSFAERLLGSQKAFVSELLTLSSREKASA